MKQVILLLACFFLLAFGQIYAGNDQKYNISAFNKQLRIDEPAKQADLRHQNAWQNFSRQNGHWYAEFNALTGLPMRAAGAPVSVNTSGTDAELALSFITDKLKGFKIPAEALQPYRINRSHTLRYVQFTQYYQTLPVLGNGLSVRLNANNEAVAFTADVFHNISLNTQAAISANDALQLSVADVPGNYTENSTPMLKVLPIPTPSGYEFKLVYDFTIKGTPISQNEPVNFRVWIDAHNGNIYYRSNMVCSFDVEEAQSLYAVNAQVTPNPNFAQQAVSIPHMRIRVGVTDYFTDANGNLDYVFPPGIPSTVNGTAYLDGPYSRVYNGANGTSTPNFPVSIVPGGTEITVPNTITASQISGFYYVTQQHNFMRTWIPAMTAMDFPMITRVDRTDGNCNAFYDGGVNFYAQGGGCFSTSLFSDIIFHEYGHGINDYFYNFKGGNFNNGSLGEGYADVWALAHTENPILSQGFNIGAGNSSIRRYDINPKVYPQDLTGEVHDNGEIIAGAWWDLGVEIGLDNMFTIFINSHDGVPMRPDGQEGTLYSDILFEALIADDDNGNLSDGTPHSIAIIDNFALHGIFLQIAGDIVHTEYPLIEPTDLAQINFTLSIDFNYLPFVEGVGLYYRTDRTQPYTYTNAVTLAGGSNYTGFIPFLVGGTIVDYYMELEDNVGGVPLSEPYLANRTANPNLPFQMLVGYETLSEDHLFGTAAQWTIGAPDDDASTGVWTIGSPNSSFINDIMVQTDTDNTPDANNNCAFTGNGTSGGAAGQNDVDDGKTTLTSKAFNLLQFDEPAFSYYRWYSNDQGANPGNDNWEVYISSNGGVTWVPVENTNVPDHSWRLAALRVQDYVELSSDVRLRFIASDNLIPGTDYDGGSLVEAAIDDLVLYEVADPVQTGITNAQSSGLQVYPNPAQDYIMLQLPTNTGSAMVTLYNTLGQQVFATNTTANSQTVRINTATMAQGVYLLQVNQGSQSLQQKVIIGQ